MSNQVVHVLKEMSRNSGFTLIEVILFVSLISVVFITFASLSTAQLHSSRINEHKIIATHLGEELREWLRGEKEENWNTFITTRMDTWCFNTEPISSWGTSGSCGYDLNNRYKRTVVLEAGENNTQVTADIVVSWMEGQNSYQVPIAGVFTILE